MSSHPNVTMRSTISRDSCVYEIYIAGNGDDVLVWRQLVPFAPGPVNYDERVRTAREQDATAWRLAKAKRGPWEELKRIRGAGVVAGVVSRLA